MWITDLIHSKRWFIVSLLVALLVPAGVLAGLSFFAKDMSKNDMLEVASVAVKNYIDENPPREGWRATKVYIGKGQNIVVDVHVPIFEQAEIIKSRNDRIKYSYLKLACPPQGAWVYDWLGDDSQIWINLNHHGKTLFEAPCPASLKKGYLS